MYREAERIADDLGKVLDKSVKLEWHKYSNQRERCMRITAKEEKLVRKQLQRDYTILETRKDGTKFTSKGMKTLAKRLSKLTDKYDECQKDLVAQVVGVASTFAPVWQRVSGLVAELDCLCGFADLACSAPRPYCKPEVLPSSTQRISLKGWQAPPRGVPGPRGHRRRRRRNAGGLHPERLRLGQGNLVPGRHGAQHGRQVDVHQAGRRRRAAGAVRLLCPLRRGDDLG